MKISKKDIVVCFVVFAGTVLASWLFLILSASIPNVKLQDNMIKSALAYAQEEAFSYCDGRKMNGISDNYADSIWLNVAWYMGKGNPILSTLDTKYYDGGEYGENIGLYLAVSDEGTWDSGIYPHFAFIYRCKRGKSNRVCCHSDFGSSHCFFINKREKYLISSIVCFIIIHD